MPRPQELRKVLFESAEAARKALLRRFGRLPRVGKKGGDETNLVTIADKEAERAIMDRVGRAFPDHAILAEESGAVAAAGESDYCWVIDPLDGTTNYAHTLPIFSISIAVQHRGHTILALVVDPTRDEWFFARQGGGAFLNRRRIRVSSARKISQSLVVTGFPHGRRKNIDHFMKILGGVLMRARSVVRLGSAALDLCAVACGRADGFWEENLEPWDVAAGNLIVEEAGGRVTSLAGRRSGIFDKEFVASNGLIHRELLSIVREHWSEW